MLELTNLLAGGGSPPQFQDFTISGTFTPSTKLLEKGGTVMVVLFGGGSGGGSGAGHGAVPKVVFTKVTGPVSVVIGALFPACAGMNRRPCGRGRCRWPVPRVRGDEPASLIASQFHVACSPRARG